MRLLDVQTFLRQHQQQIQAYGVNSIAIFGSVARDEATLTSDIDLLVDFSGQVTFDRYMDLKFYLEDHLGRKVDLISPQMLKPQIRQTILKDAVYVT